MMCFGSVLVTMVTLGSTPAAASLFFNGQVSEDIFPSKSDLPLTTCDQCTIYSGYEWCPIDFSCHQNSTACGSHCKAQAAIHPTIAALYPMSAGSEDNYCVDVQYCFYGASKCSDCVFGGGTWCPASRTCFMFNERPSDNDTDGQLQRLPAASRRHVLTSGRGDKVGDPIYSSFICAESCSDGAGNVGQCVPTDDGCPECERFHPSLSCSALLPVLILSSFGSALIAFAILYATYVFVRRVRAEYQKKEVEKQRLQARKMARSRARAKKRQLQQEQIKKEQDEQLAGHSGGDDDDDAGEGNGVGAQQSGTNHNYHTESSNSVDLQNRALNRESTMDFSASGTPPPSSSQLASHLNAHAATPPPRLSRPVRSTANTGDEDDEENIFFEGASATAPPPRYSINAVADDSYQMHSSDSHPPVSPNNADGSPNT